MSSVVIDTSTAWKNYQAISKNNARDRVELLNLRKYGGKGKTLVDLGANQGEFAIELTDDFDHIHSVEPYVEPLDLPGNVTRVVKGFKDFISVSTMEARFDVVFSFAMTIQVKEFDHMTEDQIAEGHYWLTKPGGTMIYETQKVDNRQDNTVHVYRMLAEFTRCFGIAIESGNARGAGGRKYYVFQR